MLELLFLSRFGRALANIAKGKGRSRGWAALGVGFWFLGEIMGFLVGSLLNLGIGSYLLGLGVAGAGAFVSYTIVKSLAPLGEAAEPSPS
jgi:hypothetical protein